MRFARVLCFTSVFLALPLMAGAQGAAHGDIRVSATVLSITETVLAGAPSVSSQGADLLVTVPLTVRNNVVGAPMSATFITRGGETVSAPVTCGASTGPCGLPMLFNAVYPVVIHLTGLTATERRAYLADPSLLSGRLQASSVRSSVY
jgi:hypothetical protein